MTAGNAQNKEYALAFQRGEEKAYDYFFRLYFQALCFYARKLLPSQHEPEDLVMDCFLKLWEKRQSIVNADAIRSYLYTTVRNACIDLVRKKELPVTPVTNDEAVKEDPFGDAEKAELLAETIRQLYHELSTIPAKLQQVITLSYFDEKKDKEISSMLDIPVSTLQKQRYRIISLLRKKLASRKNL